MVAISTLLAVCVCVCFCMCDTCRPIVKDHTSLVLRAENVSTKYEWIQRMMRAVAAAAGPPPPPPVAAQQPAPAAAPAPPQPGAGGDALCTQVLARSLLLRWSGLVCWTE